MKSHDAVNKGVGEENQRLRSENQRFSKESEECLRLRSELSIN